jgi:hypothetical protein
MVLSGPALPAGSTIGAVRWLVDGYNVIRRAPSLAALERESLEAGRAGLCRLLADVARRSGDRFVVVFDGARAGGAVQGAAGVAVMFSSARETADRVLARLASGGGAVVSNDREVRAAAARAGALAIGTDDFLARIERLGRSDEPRPEPGADKEEDAEDARPSPRRGNPRRLPKKARAAARALRRLEGR